MKQLSLEQYFLRARKEGWAIFHFNFSTLDQLHAICEAAQELQAPVMVGTAEKELRFVGAAQAVALVKSFKEQGAAIFLNADHCKSSESAIAALRAGYDSVHIDLSREPSEKNYAGTKEVVDFAKKNFPEAQVEGELGYLVTDASKVYYEEPVIPEESYPKVAEAVRYVQQTGISRLAPAVGTIHGIIEGKPLAERLRLDLISELAKALPQEVALVLHGGSGVSEDQIKEAISLGMTNIHISTQLRVVYRRALEQALAANASEVAPYGYLQPAKEAVRLLAKEQLNISGSSGRVSA